MNERELIARYIAPLAGNEKAARGLLDDAAVLPGRAGHEWVITADALAEGVHFLPGTEPELVARKLLRVNLSDMAAMGATPRYYLVTATVPEKAGAAWWRAFTGALAEEQKAFGIALIGGDTVRHGGGLSLSLTMLGEVPAGKALPRSGAKPGDLVYVSGTIGDAVCGLKILQRKLTGFSASDRRFLVSRYHLPQPRVELGKELRGLASAAMDVSDGLIGDLEKICRASGVGAEVDAAKIPLSEPVRKYCAARPELFNEAITGGDDYELLFTIPAQREKELAEPSSLLSLGLTRIGHIVPGKSVKLRDKNGRPIKLKTSSYSHY